ncbi:hypothetical protein HHK36_012996 [Tetracentron sinense]|uniref:S-protein homolog n=1 Tax=Tetracentron sinense TaxID=13715 RepID=A0A834Z6W5_TETSI|nr:hypothetical protein HHK36_012996 [Tetracentron sinense]
MTSFNSYVLLLVLALALSEPLVVLGKFHVHVYNGLGEGQTLGLHCKSKDDDLSIQWLAYRQEFSWSFNVNIWRTTLFVCHFQWGNTELGYFEVFKALRDDDTNARLKMSSDTAVSINVSRNTITPPLHFQQQYKMTTSTSYVLLLLALALSESAVVLGKYHVYVINELDKGSSLTIHCKSKDDDLGMHVLPYGSNFTWSFNVNLWGTTLFWCTFQLGELKGQYNVFKARRDSAFDIVTTNNLYTQQGLKMSSDTAVAVISINGHNALEVLAKPETPLQHHLHFQQHYKMTTSTSYVLLLVLALALSEPSTVLGKYHVYVINALDKSSILTIHCRSKDDDLGRHRLTYGSNFTWSFKANLWRTTLFYCNFQMGDLKGHYNVFMVRRDSGKCNRFCLRAVKWDGLYFYDWKAKKYQLEYIWPR